MSDATLNQVVELALKLSLVEQAKALELIAAHLATEVGQSPPDVDERLDWTDEEFNELIKPGTPRTGAEIAAMIDSGELETNSWSEMINPHITDPVEWLKALRREI